jgi:glucose-6-phosphate isomerase
MINAVPGITAFVDSIRASGLTKALLLGMGGSSLAPELFRMVFGVRKGYLDLEVLDSTDPGAVLEKGSRFDPAKTLFIVSTKSGGTVETLSFMKYFYNRTVETVGAEKAGEHFTAITDPGSKLEKIAGELKYRKIFLNDPNIGGRYSALSFFGLVPAALIGVDLLKLLERAGTIAGKTEECSSIVDNTAARFGAAMGELASAGRDKLTIAASPAIAHFGAWAEQLIAESTGKEGRGILPVDGEILTEPQYYADDRFFVYLRLKGDNEYDAKIEALREEGHPVVRFDLGDIYDIGGEFFRWEMATAVAGALLGINPFEQPNVESAKVLAREMVSAYREEGKLPVLVPTLLDGDIKVYTDEKVSGAGEAIRAFLARAEQGKNEYPVRIYAAIQAYLEPTSETDAALQELRTRIQMRFRLATTLGYGPRFLHSTGQLHKGDSGNGLFIQITADMPRDAAIPDKAGENESSISFGILKDSQALGDRQALLDNKRSFIRFHLGGSVAEGLRRLTEAVK